MTEELFIGDDADCAQTGAYDIWEASNAVSESKHANSDRPVENSGAPCVRRQSFPARRRKRAADDFAPSLSALEHVDIATPLTPSEEPLLQDDIVESGPEVLCCVWCKCVDGSSQCTKCGRILCTECRMHHQCTLHDFNSLPRSMALANKCLPFLNDFEALRAMRTCRIAGFGYAKLAKTCTTPADL